MKIIYLLFICFTCTFSTKSGCTNKLNEVSIYPTTNETLTWNIKSEFFDGPDLIYSLSDPTSKQFQIINPIQQNNVDISHAAINIKATKAAKIQSNGFWLNTFALLEETNQGYFLYIAEGNDAKTAPNFNQKHQITQNNQTTCYDIDFIDNETYIIDCQRIIDGVNTTIIENVLFIKNKNGQQIELKEEALFKAYKQRFIGLYSKQNSLGILHQYLFRITPAYSISLDSELAQDSLIEVYLIIDGKPQNTNFVLDSASLAYALGIPSISFTLVDFQIQSNGDIYLLDAFNGIYIINYLPNGEWLIKKQINPQIGQAFAFSINSLIKQDDTLAQVIVVQGYNYFVHIENNEILFIYDLPFTQLDYPSYIGLSQENVIIRKGNLIYLYNIDTDNVELNSKLVINNTDFILLNPFLPDIIIISSKLSKRYTLSMGYLKYLGNNNVQEQQLITLIATTPNQQKCQVQIMYQILEDNDPLIYQLKDNQIPFPQKLTENNLYSTLMQLTSGPNLQYEQVNKLQESNLNIDIQKRWLLESQIQWPQNVIYAYILVLEQQTQFYQIIQTDDLNLHIWLCDHVKQYDKNIICTKLIDKLQIGVKITKQTFNLWRHELQNIYFMYLDTEYSITIKFYHQGELKIFKRIVYENNKIKSIFFAENNFFVIRDDNIILAYSTYSHDNDILTIADTNTFKSYGYTYEWKPQRLFGNRKLHPNLLFILNEDNIILVDFHTQFTYLQQFAYTKGIEIEITIAEDTFFIVYGKTTVTDGKIEEYNFSRLNNIFKVKTIQLYWYQIQQPLIIDQSEGNGILYIRAYCLYTKLSHILVIKPNTLQHDTLIEAWSQYEEDNEPLIMAVDGNEQMFLYTFCKGQTKFTQLLINPIILIQPQINQLDYQSNVNVTLQISNFKFPEKKFNTINIKQSIQVFYTQTIIQLDNNKFKDGITIDSNIKNRIYDLGNDWYSGQITGMQLDCEQCNTNIELLNIVQNQNPSIFNGYEIRDLIRYDDNYNIFQATKGLIFTNHENQLVAVYDFDLPSSTYQCYQTQVSQDKIIIYSLCQDKGQYTIYATGCISITGCSPLGEKFQFEQASKIQLIGNEILVVLHTDNKYPQDQDGSIVIYQIKIGLKQWNLEVLDVITLQTLNSKLNKKLEYFRPSDFQVIKQYSNQGNYYYKIMISNSMNGFIFYDFSIIDSSRYNQLFTEQFDLTQYLNNQVNQYILEDTYYLQLKLLQEIQFDDFETMKIQLIIQTTNVAQYGLEIRFKKIQSSYSQLNDIQLLFVLNRYKDWQSINKIAVKDNRIIIPYINNNNIMFGLYDITHNQPNIPYTIIGATYIFSSQQPINMALFFHLDNRNIFYINQQQGALQSYEIRDTPQISINNKEGDLKNQIITLIVQNDFNAQQVQFKLDVIQVDLHECKTLINNIHIYPSTNEILQWQLNDGIFEGVGLKYTLNENIDFSIIEPLSLIKTNKNKEKFNGIQSIKAQNVQDIWNNKFAVFSITPISNILYFTNTTTFDFNANIIIDPEAPGIVCNDFDYANNQNNEFLIDCQYKTEKRIYWGTINQLKILSTIESPFPINNQRFVTQMIKNNSTYLLRVTPAYSFTQDHSLSKQSLIELFLFEDSKLTQKSSIDNQKLAKLLNKDKVNFVLVDYKLHNGYLYLLDVENGLIALNYEEQIEDWTLAIVQILEYQNPMAFDIETYIDNKGQSIEHIVILCYNYFIVIENSNVVKIQDLNYYVSTYPQRIQLSQRFVFIQNDIYLYMYHFNDEQVNLVDVSIKQGGILVNKNTEQLIQIDLTDSNQYTFTQGLLQYQYKSNLVSEGQLTITATSINNQRCISQIKYSILKNDDSTIYKKTDSTTPLPNILTINNDFDLGDLASGPNMVYEVKNDTIVQIIQSNNVFYEGMTDSDLIFVDSIESKSQLQYFQQKKNKFLVLYNCRIKEDKFDCKNQNQIELGLGLNQQIFSTWQSSKLYFIIVDELYSIKLYAYSLLNFELLKQFQFQKIEEQSILAQTPLEQSFIVLQKNGQLSAYSLQDYSQLIKITGEQLIGFVGTWKPIALFSNPQLQPTLFFVQNEDNIVLINYINNQFIHIKTMYYVKESQIYISLSERTFFIVENQRISEYTYANLFNLQKLKDVVLFDQEIILPLNARFQRSTGNLLITTKNKKDKTFISIFKPDQTLHETNYFLQQKLNLGDLQLFSVCGDNEMYVNPFLPILQVIHIIQQSPKLYIQADKINYIEDTKIQLTISNSKDNNNQIDFEQQIKLINTFTNFRSENIYQNYTIKKNETFIQEIQSPTKYTHIIDSSIVFCIMNELGDFKLQTFLDLIQKSDQKYKINYGYAYKQKDKTQNTQYLYLQASTTMLLVTVNDEKLNVQKAEYELSDNYDCFRLDNYESYFYSLCNNGIENQLLIINCEKKCQLENSYIPQQNGIAILSIYKNIVAILHTHPQSPQNYNGYITIQQLTLIDDVWESELLLKIDLPFFKHIFTEVETFNPSSIQGVLYDKVNYKLIITDSLNGLVILDFSFKDEKVQFKSIEKVHLTQWLNENKQYAFDSTLYLDTKIIKTEEKDKKLIVNLVILTSDVSTYQIELLFEEDKPLVKTIKVAFVRYGDWNVLNYLVANEKAITIPYYYDNQVTIGIYPIIDNETISSIRGGYSFKLQEDELISPLNFLMLENNNYFYNSIPNQQGFSQFKRHLTNSLIINNSLKQENQTIEINYKNDFTYKTEEITLEIIPDNDNKDAGLGTVWIILIVIGTFIALSLMGYFYYKTQAPEEEDALI